MKISRWLFCFALAGLLMWPAHVAHTQTTSSARMMPGFPGSAQPVVFYVTIKGTRQGIFRGSSTSIAHRDQIEGMRFLLQAAAPHDAATGQASGKRQYSPVMFTKEWDAASPQLFAALASNEALQSVEFEFVRSNPIGKETVFETVKLTQATISSIRQYIGVPSAGDPADPRPLEDVSFTFRKIEINNTEGRTGATDDWNAGI
jgi:type VI secretion system secreted protein Hcp